MKNYSILSAKLKNYLVGVLLLAAFITANSAYLFFHTPHETPTQIQEHRYENSTYGKNGTQAIVSTAVLNPEKEIPKFYQMMLLLHILGGLVLVVFVGVFVFLHIPEAWRRKNVWATRFGILVGTALLLLMISGLFILTEANSVRNRWIFYSHRIIALCIPLLYAGHRMSAILRPGMLKLAAGFAVILAFFLVLSGFHYGFFTTSLDAQAETDQKIKSDNLDTLQAKDDSHVKSSTILADPFIPFKPTNIGNSESFFFPSRTTTSSGKPMPRRILTLDDLSNSELIRKDIEKYGFVVNDSMGSATCVRCHAGIVEQWSKSAHRFSSFNNLFYKASVENLRKEPNGKIRSQWCGACHDPVLMLDGKMREEILPLLPESQAGLTCLACHSIDRIHGKAANGNYNISDEIASPYLFAGSKTGAAQFVHDLVIKSKPTVHKKMMLKSFYRTSEYCMTCHKVSLDLPINQYRWLRGQNDYDNWHDSGVALNASRTFYLPPKKRVCQDCHMPLEPALFPDVSAKNGMVRSHRFISVNTALPYIRGDQPTITRTEKFLQDEKLTVDIFALRPEKSEKPIPIRKSSMPDVYAGENIQLEVVVRNKGVGHTFPGGTNDSNEAWIHILVEDDAGRKLFNNGGIGSDGRVDPEAHFYKVLFVDKNSQSALKRDPQNFHTTIYTRVIGPGTADAAHYQFQIPPDSAEHQLHVTAELLWRKFNRDFTEFVFSSEKLPVDLRSKGNIPDLPVTRVASDQVVFQVHTNRDQEKSEDFGKLTEKDWMRANDYGIAQFLQNDFRTAGWAFALVSDLQPKKVDGSRNLARIAIAEGRIPEAYRLLDQSEIVAPGDPQTAWFWGLAKKGDGLYEEAAHAFERVLAYFPEDRASWVELGRILYRNGQYERALNAFLEVLEIDPENLVAHYHRVLCYRALGMENEAAEAEKAYEKYQIDESAAAVTQKYRLEHPIDNRESQAIHVHELSRL